MIWNCFFEQLIKKSLLRVLRKKLILSSGKLFEIGQNIFFENITDNIATTDWMFLSTIIGINFVLFLLIYI